MHGNFQDKITEITQEAISRVNKTKIKQEFVFCSQNLKEIKKNMPEIIYIRLIIEKIIFIS